MRLKNKKGFKPLLIKSVAVFMAICYLLTPLHRQINTVFHSVSHFLEIPVDVMSHSEYEFLEDHRHDNHYTFEDNHEHSLIDFLHSIFKASDNEDKSKESLASTLKIDKHFFSSPSFIKKPFYIVAKNGFCEIVRQCNEGYSQQLYDPPRYFIVG